ncbi:Smr/MutS family protein [Castellaniella sp.]|uniref:Smr/MutS family protein n=1 Tax=Castellaniella sp. TaxID=1955812 RepID=UPI002B002E68|nr:Smr/MutS family protein [Castellaniella sp.]
MKDIKPTLADLRRLRAAAQEAASSRATIPPAASSSGTAAAHHPESPPLAASDRALFRQAMRFVQPLPDQGPRARVLLSHLPDAQLRTRREHAQGGPEVPQLPLPPRQRHHRQAAFDPEAGEFLQAGCGPDLLRGLRRGKWIAQATLDLHGSTADEARERLDRFLLSCLEHGIRCVRIIHGKGIGSRQGEPILKAAVRQHLSRLEAIQAWVQGGERDGGAGAVTALLRLPAP